MTAIARRLMSAGSIASLAVPAGIAAHCAGYEIADRLNMVFGPADRAHHLHGAIGGTSAAAVDNPHSHHIPLVPLTTGALLLGVLVILACVATARRVGGLPRIDLGKVIAAQFAVAAGIEIAGLVDGARPSSAAVIMALVLQVPVALAVFSLGHQVRRLVARMGIARRAHLPAPAIAPSVPVHITPVLRHVWALSSPVRGPPVARLALSRPCTVMAG